MAEAAAKGGAKGAGRPRKKEKKNVVVGVAHVAATFNNTIPRA
jgi:ribosomal protein S11